MGGREYLGCLLAVGLLAILAGAPTLAVLGLILSKFIGLGIILGVMLIIGGFIFFSDSGEEDEEEP